MLQKCAHRDRITSFNYMHHAHAGGALAIRQRHVVDAGYAAYTLVEVYENLCFRLWCGVGAVRVWQRG